MECFRICRRSFRALDGEGARLYGGRWNSPGRPVVYTSATLALAAIEYLIHLDSIDAPNDLVAMRISIPDHLGVDEVRVTELPARWQRYPAPDACRKRGDAWLDAASKVTLRVPSAAIPEEHNLLFDPRHPDFRRIKVMSERRFDFDQRLLR